MNMRATRQIFIPTMRICIQMHAGMEGRQQRVKRHRSQLQEPPQLPHVSCPRCDSNDTKFCYYNNYRTSQPRYFCKTCKRHWTYGGILRDIPEGGHAKKSKKKASSSSYSTSSSSLPSSLTIKHPRMPIVNNQVPPMVSGMLHNPHSVPVSVDDNRHQDLRKPLGEAWWPSMLTNKSAARADGATDIGQVGVGMVPSSNIVTSSYFHGTSGGAIGNASSGMFSTFIPNGLVNNMDEPNPMMMQPCFNGLPQLHQEMNFQACLQESQLGIPLSQNHNGMELGQGCQEQCKNIALTFTFTDPIIVTTRVISDPYEKEAN